MKMKSPDSEVSLIMTDDDNVGWKAAQVVFGQGLHHLLCRWHLDRSWRNNVRSKVSQPNQLDIYQTLCIMESELDEEEFKRMICSFVQHWEKKETVFIKYFQENYLNRCEKWARCFRKFAHADTDMNMYLESFHNKLKTVYLNGKVNRRIDVLLDVLLKIEHDQFFQYEMKHRLLYPNKQTIKIEDAHKRGIKISPESKIFDTQWHIPSQSGNHFPGYTITKLATTCRNTNCTIKFDSAEEAQIDDSADVEMVVTDEETEDTEETHDPVNPRYSLPSGSSRSTSCEHHLQTAQNLLVQLQAMIGSGNSGLQHCLPHVNATLKKLVYTCDAASKMDTTGTITSFEDKEIFAPGKKMDLQPRFTATSNTPGHKKRKNVLHKQHIRKVLAATIDDDPSNEARQQTNTITCDDTTEVQDDVTTKKEHETVGSKRVRTRCGVCGGCTTTDDCGCCKHCKDKKKNGGPGRLKKACIKKVCTAINSANSRLTVLQETLQALTSATTSSSFILELRSMHN
ncbi:uncharacterized protein [Dysidea avara]|uniref:uncharacterized protein isoform X2 n=1 Tax=Dysidea avara TaxID=196820 RepID=UPI00331B5C35